MAEKLKSRLKRAARVLISGRDSRYYEDEMISFSLKDLRPIADADIRGDRLNVLLPSISASEAFGGLATQVDLPLQAFKRGLVEKGWQIRFICVGPAPAPEDNIVTQYLQRYSLDPAVVTCHYDSASGVPVPVGRGDRFLGSLWYNLSWAMPLMRFQQAQFGGLTRPYISMVQDYEAGFYPWSSAYMLAISSYNMEFARARGQNLSVGGVALRALSGVLHTPLVIGILCGFAVNLLTQAGLVLPQGFWAAVRMMSSAALPAALFGLGGVLYRYRPEGEARAIALCCCISLLLHPGVTFGLGKLFALSVAEMRSAVMTAAMPPGVNAYLFASLYGVAKRVSASAVLMATGLSMLSVWFWLGALP